jgi:hydroxymethylpyrimidine pyrophosphatase-like HAD family hydrolase
MRFQALAVDYDGTLAHDGRVDESTVGALDRARKRGLRNLLVTGRELTSLLNTFERADLFERVVAENGAVLYDPSTSAMDVLAGAPPPAFLTALEQAGVPFSVGHSIVATVLPYDESMRKIIRWLGLEWHVILNKRAVMAVPSVVTKATGLSTALTTLRVSADETVAVGDAENDLPFMQACGLAVAVDNALPVVKDNADVVMPAARGAGVEAVVDRLLAGELDIVAHRLKR